MNESAVFANQLRYEKILDNQKKNTKSNHRDKYAEHNRSNIFTPIPTNQSIIEGPQIQKGLKRFKTVDTFEPKFKCSTPAERKFNEFNSDNVGQKKELNPKIISNSKNVKEKVQEKPTKEMTANERKLKTLFPDKSLVEIENMRKKTTLLEEIPERNHSRAKSARQKKAESMCSNIFHDPNREKLKESIYKIEENIEKPKVEKKKYVKTPPRKIEKTRTSATFDWKKTNSEIIFKGDKDKNAKYTAKDMKKNNLKSVFDSEKTYVEFDKSILKTEGCEILDIEINEKMKENISDQNLLNKTIHGMSTLHDKDFYRKSFGNKNQDKAIQKFEIENINYDTFNLKEFKKAYISKGIHIYEVNMKGNYGNGNYKGIVSFKVRKNDDIKGFNDNLNEVNKKINNDFKVEVKAINQTSRKPLTENIPTNVSWMNSKLHYYTQHRKFDKNIHNESKSKLDVSERYASNKTLHDPCYKNSMINNTFFKKMFK